MKLHLVTLLIASCFGVSLASNACEDILEEQLASSVRLGNDILLLSDQVAEREPELRPYRVWNIRKAQSDTEGSAISKIQFQLYDQFGKFRSGRVEPDATNDSSNNVTDGGSGPATRTLLVEPDSNIKIANVKKSECTLVTKLDEITQEYFDEDDPTLAACAPVEGDDSNYGRELDLRPLAKEFAKLKSKGNDRVGVRFVSYCNKTRVLSLFLDASLGQN